MSMVIRLFASLAFLVALWIGALAVNLWVVVEHYLAAQSALTLLGTEAWPVSVDRLIGPIVGAFAPGASLPQAVALTLSVGLWLSLVLLTLQAVEIAEMARHGANMRAAGDAEEARAARWDIGKRSLLMILLVVALVPAIRWDMLLFEFRTLASPLGDPAQAPGLIRLSLQDGDFKATYAYLLATAGSWGYLGVTLACALAFEILGGEMGNKLELMGAAFERWWNPGEEMPLAEEAPVDELPVADAEPSPETPHVATETREPVVDTAGQPEAIPPPIPVAAPATARAPLFPPEIAARRVTGPPLVPTMSAPRPDAADLREVIGGRPGERVALSDAWRQKERYHIDPATNVWSRDHWESLHGVATPAEDEGRAA